MIKIIKLINQIKHYEWGSVDILPNFLGIKNKKKIPFAEMWMGTHPLSPSKIRKNLKKINLTRLSGELPFLLKLLAVDKPLSLQVHPNKEQAEEGFERENRACLSLDDPKRNYKDKNKKSEIICALSPFTLMAASSVITLQPFQAVFIPCGIPHSYKSGFGVELMNNSDNVIRGGLTNKHIDIDEFNKIVNQEQFLPQIITPDEQDVFNYPIPAGDFSLSLIRGNGRKLSVCMESPSICIVTEGKLMIGSTYFKKGDSFYISQNIKQITLKGNFTLFAASTKNVSTVSSVFLHETLREEI
jgi:mannose-6-phosphate isomerase class I